MRYQLAAFDSNANYVRLASSANVIPNLYSYLLRPPVVTKFFPFFIPRPGVDDHAFPNAIRPHGFYIAEEATGGMLVVAPVCIFALAAVAGLFPRRRGGDPERAGPSMPAPLPHS